MIRDKAFERAWAVERARELIGFLKECPDIGLPGDGEGKPLREWLQSLWLEIDQALARN